MPAKISVCLVVLVSVVGILMSQAGADTVKLKDGRVFQGTVVLDKKDVVEIRTKEGATLSFAREDVAEVERTLRGTKETPAKSLRDEIDELRQQVAELAKVVEELREKVEELSKVKEAVKQTESVVKEVVERATQVEAPRGDASEQLRLVKVQARVAGDNIKVEGYITCRGRSGGRWVRIVAEVVDGAGRVYSRGYTTPFVATPGTTVRDRAWVYPGRDVRFNVFIPWGRQDRERDMSPLDVVPDSRVIDTVVCRLPRREKRRRVVVKLEIPPKIKIPAAAGKSPAEGRR